MTRITTRTGSAWAGERSVGRRSSPGRSAWGWVGAACVAAVAALAGAHPAQAQPTKGTILAVERAAPDKLLVDPKDQALVKALAMIPARVRELPLEIEHMPPELATFINLAISTLARPARLMVTYNTENPPGGGGLFGYGLVVSVDAADQADADAMHGQIGALLLTASEGQVRSKPSKAFQGMSEIDLKITKLAYGPRKTKGGDWRYELVVGSVQDPDAGWDTLPKARPGSEPVLRARLDLAGMTPLVNMISVFTARNPELAARISDLEPLGLWGADALKMSLQMGYTESHMVGTFVLEGAKARAKALSLPTEPLTKEDFKAIPSDAWMVSLQGGGLEWLAPAIANAAEQAPPFAEFLEQFKESTGVDLQEDVLGSLGGGAAMYLSDSTGGGSLGSAVAMLAIKDRPRFAAAHGKLLAIANSLAQKIPDMNPGYVRLHAWKDGTADMVSLRFPGLPVPVEITYAITGKWLILAPTPQGALAAARQAEGKGDDGLMANKAFASAYKADRKAVSIAFSDTSRSLRGGYLILTMLGSAIGNAVRSPVDPTRDPGLIVPTYNELRANVKPSVQMTFWEGDNFVTESWGDRSLLVNAGSLTGIISEFSPLIAAGVIGGLAGSSRPGGFGMGPDTHPWPEFAADQPDQHDPRARPALLTGPAGHVPVDGVQVHDH